jgi:Siphovirus ReqiPepy6 Gp37-like protein
MDLFRFAYDVDPTDLRGGELINGATSKMWVERYSTPGEFEIISPLDANLRAFLPLGTVVGQQDSYEVMIVENHEIVEDPETDPVLKTTGRSYTSYFEQRVVGLGLAATRADGDVSEYPLLSDILELQIANLIDETLVTAFDADDNLPSVEVVSSASSVPIIERTVKYGYLSDRVKELLAINDLGIKTIRRNDFGSGSTTKTRIEIYLGVDKTEDVIFSWRTGDLEQAQYLFSLKNRKNCAFVFGRWLFTTVDGTETNYERRMLMVDANDLDSQENAAPSGGTRTAILAKMVERGQTALRAQQGTSIAQADISNIRQYRYRTDFNVGDIVRLQGNFGEIANMRITEYTEIEDETGESSHPTLSLPGV